MKVLITDGWAVGYCSKGMRAFCARHNISYIEFARDGIDASILEQIDDHMVHKILEAAHGRKQEDDGRS